MIDRVQWTALIALLVVEEVVVLIGRSLRSGWFVIKEKIALESRRLRK